MGFIWNGTYLAPRLEEIQLESEYIIFFSCGAHHPTVMILPSPPLIIAMTFNVHRHLICVPRSSSVTPGWNVPSPLCQGIWELAVRRRMHACFSFQLFGSVCPIEDTTRLESLLRFLNPPYNQFFKAMNMLGFDRPPQKKVESNTIAWRKMMPRVIFLLFSESFAHQASILFSNFIFLLVHFLPRAPDFIDLEYIWDGHRSLPTMSDFIFPFLIPSYTLFILGRMLL